MGRGVRCGCCVRAKWKRHMNLKTPNAIATVNPNEKTREAPRFKYNSRAYRMRNRLMFPTEAAGFDGLVLTFAQDDRGV